ncbi:FAD/NAD(P)-binding domain-containing protein [Bimuria novae-zelandiae CBS 107.79]|uniref:FAD/NAD(P)-binding domain-containing protein n=1 Tax=Bimuria novae-zelandiae CBS 107.79 TaxID=1447943 RepID=A0A6A5VIJ6_9PLEO|nr:FAD/NAD(P)-binding domain-containing protein [Bimuria novae-zelandiae CBS 107.79]
MPPKDFKDIIAGGSITGLTLANMLEKLVGASIGLLPNGLRVLDQLGLYPALRSLIEKPTTMTHLRGPDGRILNKHKVLLSKKVVKVQHEGSKVRVTTEDGSEFMGDIVVGADGVHSAVRQEMWELADQLEPRHTEYNCIFGISIMKDFKPYTSYSVLYKHSSLLVVSGPKNRVYWFLFQNAGEKSDTLPRFTKVDALKLAKEHWDDKVTDGLSFGDLYSSKISSILTPLPEYVFKRWHYKCIITIGDAAHKFEPISGQGGNSAIETAAVLVNNLTQGFKNHSEGLSDADIDHIFSTTQRQRSPRIRRALETPFLEIFANGWTRSIEGGHRLNMQSVPKRHHYAPFPDELVTKPLENPALVRLVFASLFLVLFTTARKALTFHPDPTTLPTFASHEPKTSYTSIPPIDAILSTLVGAFAGPPTAQTVQCLYLIVALTSAPLIWTIESYRNGNRSSLVAFPVLFGLACQLHGVGKFTPLYYLASMYTTSSVLYTRTTGRAIPGVALGFLLPTILMFRSYEDAALFPLYVGGLTCLFSTVLARVDPEDEYESLFRLHDVAPLCITYGVGFVVTALSHVATLIYVASNASLSLAGVFGTLPSPNDMLVGASTSVFDFFKWDAALYFSCTALWSAYSISG